jgi:tetratricopeptide (TPR) repeat protein
MALFGFNKQKVLATAEKYVQQGKLPNAITEYEKILKNDPKDLTVTNTVGDLYSRGGESDKATECFKTVGDAYASQGFTVKAIAMYKKICKLQPSLESLLKLAELYTQQGLFNDARAQYLQVAEEFLKAGELENAVRIFQKILEMDPENSTMRVRLAEVYIRLGKKTEAWQIFSSAAESLRSRGSLTAADEVLQRMLTLDPGNTYALLMQGKNLIEAGDAAGAVTALSKVSDIDSNPDGLRDLLKAYLQSGQLSEAGGVANKLLTVHNDLPAIASFADALMQAGQYENALQVFDQHAERLLAENSDKVLEALHTIIGHVRENPDSLQRLLDLFHKAGETTHVGEVMELLAHASVQSGDLPRARDLYQRLATIEPQNPLHMQNYQQVVSQLGGTSGSKLITPEEAVVLIDDLEASAPSIHQHYSDEIALAIRAALTDAELFISYNMPAKALGPLVGALPMAPTDLRLNQRLAALHTRAGRFAEAGMCCRTLQSIYSEADHPEEATRYGELADRYEDRAATRAASAEAEEAPIFLDAAPGSVEGFADSTQIEEGRQDEIQVDEVPVDSESSTPEFSVDAVPGEHGAVAEVAADSRNASASHAGASPWPTLAAADDEITIEPAENEFAVVDESSADAVASSEIDLSSEWDDSVSVEADEPAAGLPAAKAERVAAGAAEHEPESSEKADEAIEEIRFYLAHGMPEQAMAALAKLQTLTTDRAKVAQLRAEVEAAATPEEEIAVAAEPEFEEITAGDIPSLEAAADLPELDAPEPEVPAEDEAAAVQRVEMEPVDVEPVEIEAVEVRSAGEIPADTEEPVAVEAAPPVVEEVPVEHIPVVAEAAVEPVLKTAARHPVPAIEHPQASIEPEIKPESAPDAGVLKEFVSDLETSLGDSFLPGTVVKPVAAPAIVVAVTKPAAKPAAQVPAAHAPVVHAATVHSEPAAGAPSTAAVLGEFVADIEASLGEDFLKAAPVVDSAPIASTSIAYKPVAPLGQTAPAVPPVAPQPSTSPLAASAAASASATSHVGPVVPAAWPAPALEIPAPHPAATAHAPVPSSSTANAAPVGKSSAFAEDAGVDLAEMFGELKQDLESDVASADEDPETHYNLGIAFREMGLLDEAIGELQKACQFFDRGHAFPQIMQTYTWLANCFLEKGVPEAAVRWYDKALNVPGIDGETRVALHYELAAAYEAAGDKTSALKHFMNVYGNNIDYRDVAERIKALKS